MGIDGVRSSPPRAARRTALSFEALTAAGAAAGVVGFLSGTFDALVEQVNDAWPIVQGRILPALALACVVAVPHAAALGLGLRRHPRAPDVGLAAGAALLAWLTLQLVLIGWTTPVQWVFVVVAVVEVVAAIAWRRQGRPGG